MSNARFWDKIARKYAARPIGDAAAYEDKLAKLQTLLGARDRVLELGCGTGGTARRLAPQVAEMVATDISPEMIAIARERLADEGGAPAAFHVATAETPPPGAPFDAVLAFSLLHLVDDLPATLASVQALLRPGGRFISKTVCLGNGQRYLAPLIAVMRFFGKAPHVAILSTADVTSALRTAGFEIDEVTYFGTRRHSPFIVARKPG